MTSAVNGIRGALAVPAARAERACSRSSTGRATSASPSAASSPRTSRTGTGRCTCRKPRAIFLDDPHDGGFAGFGEPALDDSLAGIPSTVKLAVPLRAPTASSPSRARRDAQLQRGLPEARAHPEAEQGPRAHATPTTTATPPLSSEARRVRRRRRARADAYDWNFCWKVWDALRSCAYAGTRLPLRARRHAAASLHRQLERRRADRAAEDPGRGADPPAAGAGPRARAELDDLTAIYEYEFNGPTSPTLYGFQPPGIDTRRPREAAKDRASAAPEPGARRPVPGGPAGPTASRSRRPVPPGRRPAPAPGRAARPPPARAPSSARDPARRPPRLDGLPGRGRADSQRALRPGSGGLRPMIDLPGHVDHQPPHRRPRVGRRPVPRGSRVCDRRVAERVVHDAPNANEQALTGDTADKVKAAALAKLRRHHPTGRDRRRRRLRRARPQVRRHRGRGPRRQGLLGDLGRHAARRRSGGPVAAATAVRATGTSTPPPWPRRSASPRRS